MKYSFLFSFLITIGTTFVSIAQTTVIPDLNFENYLETHTADGAVVSVGDPLSMGDGVANNNLVTTANITDVVQLNVGNQNITDLTGVEAFASLESLICDNNNLSDINVSSLTNLKTLLCGLNQLSALDISANTALEVLDCSSNQIAVLNVGNNTSLNRLICTKNQLATIDVSLNTDLFFLGVSENKITFLDVDTNTKLEQLFCASNQIVNLNLNNNTVLNTLDVSNNLIFNLDLSAINTMVCPNPQTDPITICQGTSAINVSNNQLSSLIVANGFSNLISLFNSEGNPDLSCIQIDSGFTPDTNWTKDDWTYYAETTCMNIYTYVPDGNFEQELINQGLDDVLDNLVLTDNINGINILDVSNSNIESLVGIEDFGALHTLNCSTNSIEELDISNNTLLTNFDGSGNSLTSLDLSNQTGLTILNVSINALDELDLSGNLSIENLNCSNNNIQSLNLSNHAAITDFNCEFNALEVLNLKNGTNGSLANFSALNNADLSCIETDTGTVPVGVTWTVDASSAYAISCGTYVPDDGFEQAIIDAGFDVGPLDNYVPTINIENEMNLDVSNYNIVDLTGIQDFADLQFFNCSNNTIVELNLTTNTALTSITCNNNALEFVDIRNGNNTNVTVFNATNNPNLFCINVDAAVIGNIPGGWTIDPIANYNDDCENNRYTPIPDVNFEQALIDSGIDVGAIDGQVLTANIEHLNSLDVNNKNIESLEGIKAFLSLTELNCSNNYLNELDVSNMLNLEELYCSSNYFLTNNPANTNGLLNTSGVLNLRKLHCSGNFLADIDVTTLFNLDDLDCSDNKIETLNITNNTLLQYLNCSNNELQDLNINNLNVLISLNCSVNSISHLTTSAINNNTLTQINCSNNDLNALQIDNYLGLEDLDCNRNSIANLNTSNNTLLESLNCSTNTIGSLDLSTNTNLVTVYASDNDLVQIELANNTALEYLDCNYNAITAVDVSGLSNLKYLYINNNDLNNLDLSNINSTNLIVVDASFNVLTDLMLLNDLSQLKTLNCNNNALENDFDLSTLGTNPCPGGDNLCPEFISINLSNNLIDFVNIQNGVNGDITNFNVTSNPNLHCIQVDDVNNIGANWVKDVDAEYSIDCRFGETYVPDDNFEQALITLGYDIAPLDDYVLTDNIIDLTILDISGNAIADLTGIEDFEALQVFNCSNNNLSTIDVSNNKELVEINCSNNALSTIDVSNNPDVVNINIANNMFTEFDVSSISTLEVFNCNENSIVVLDFATNASITNISCTMNLLEVLNLQNGQNPNISNLNAQNNPDLSCIQTDDGTVPGGVTWLKDAATQYAVNCRFEETYVPDDNFEQALIDFGFDVAPLDDYVPTPNIQNVSFLNIANNEIADLTGIEDFENLTVLNFEGNLITTVDLSGNLQLTTINASGNQLSGLDISFQSNLRVLNISNNNFTQIDFSNNLGLLQLNISENLFASLNVSSLLDLSILNCSSNQLTELDVTLNNKLTELICASNLFFQDNLNLQNGANSIINTFNATDNPDLSCILVDNPVDIISNVGGIYSNWQKDDTANYQTICDDADNDGVANEDDLCPGTPFGEPVDLFGCTYSVLPEDNFTILITDETCLNNNDGKINITTKEFYEYKAHLVGDDFDRDYTFTNEIDILNLLAGTYRLCITSDEIPNFERCFDVVINHPENLDVITNNRNNGKEVNVQMSGSSNYTIDFNGLVFTTSNSEITLQLEDGKNTISISTDKPCQGIHEEQIFLSNKMFMYPNPFQNQFNIYLGDFEDNTVGVNVYSYLGQLVYSKEIDRKNSRSLTVDANNFSAGLHTVFVTSSTSVSIFKIVKK